MSINNASNDIRRPDNRLIPFRADGGQDLVRAEQPNSRTVDAPARVFAAAPQG